VEKELYFYIGTYTEPILFGTGEVMQGKGAGIYLYKMNSSDGSLNFCEAFGGIPNPSYLAVSPSGKYLYCVNELKQYKGAVSGSVSAFSIEKGTGKLDYLNTVASQGGDPCYICVNNEETHVFVSNFMTGSVSMLPIDKYGRLKETSCVIQHQGGGPHPQRQKGPHAHSVVLDIQNEIAFVPDLGIDKIMVYRIDYQNDDLIPQDKLHIAGARGAGPRHCVFNQEGNTLYVINELSLGISVYAYDAVSKSIQHLQTLDDIKKEGDDHIGADIDIHPGGRFLYASIRGQDMIVCYEIDAETHKLRFRSRQGSGGKTPRNFSIEPGGRYLFAGNQDSDVVVVFSIDEQSGDLAEISRIPIPNPVCIKSIWL
jgi:6-phosphogluconolactonase